MYKAWYSHRINLGVVIMKDEKSEVAKRFECGIKLKDNIDFQEGDIIECYLKQQIKVSFKTLW